MKRLFLLLCCLLPALLPAEDITRADGSILKGTVLRAEPDGLVVETEAGVEKIDFTLLSAEWQKRYQYDPAKAEQYRAARAAAQQQQLAQQVAAVRAQQAALAEKQAQQQPASPEEAARQVRVEQSVIFVTAAITQGGIKGVRADLSVQTGRAASSMLDKDTRATVSLGSGFIYGLEGAPGETWQGKLFPAGYYHYTTSLGEEDTMRAYALTVEDAMARGADGRGPAVPSVNPAAPSRALPGNLRGGTLLDK